MFLKFYLFLREGGREREKERERGRMSRGGQRAREIGQSEAGSRL